MTQRSTRAAAALIIDQALYSGSNFVFVLAQSRDARPGQFANFAAAAALLVLAVALGRYVFHEPAMAGVVPGTVRVVGLPVRSLYLYWLVATATITVVAVSLLGTGALGIAIITPLVLVQDQRRYALFSGSDAHRAVAADAIWTVAVLPMLFVHCSVDSRTIWWGLAAGASCVVTWVRHAEEAEPVAAATRGIGERRYIIIDFLINELSVPIGLLLLARSHLTESAATFRIVLIPFGVLWVAVGALRSLGIAEHRRLAPPERRKRATAISAMSAVLALLLWLVLAAVGPSTWVKLIGPSWPTTGAIVALAGLLHVAKAAQTGALLDLKADARFRVVCWVRVSCGLVPMLAGWWAAALGSASGLMAALGVGEILTFLALVAIGTGHLPAWLADPPAPLAASLSTSGGER